MCFDHRIPRDGEEDGVLAPLFRRIEDVVISAALAYRRGAKGVSTSRGRAQFTVKLQDKLCTYGLQRILLFIFSFLGLVLMACRRDSCLLQGVEVKERAPPSCC